MDRNFKDPRRGFIFGGKFTNEPTPVHLDADAAGGHGGIVVLVRDGGRVDRAVGLLAGVPGHQRGGVIRTGRGAREGVAYVSPLGKMRQNLLKAPTYDSQKDA